jgi:hypothetical protein
MSEFEDLQKLLRLKRYEQPPEDYMDKFVDEFRQRQRSEMLKGSSRGLLFERVVTYFEGFGKARWGYAIGGACAAALVAFSLIPRSAQPLNQSGMADSGGNLTSVSSTPVPAMPQQINVHPFDEIEVKRALRDGRASAAGQFSRDSIFESSAPLFVPVEHKQSELFDKEIRIIEF